MGCNCNTDVSTILFFICLDKPFNPLVTSGGILSASLLLQLVKPEMDDLARKYEYVQNIFEVKNLTWGHAIKNASPIRFLKIVP
jgi:hypothetical protein